jgi:hypothetical protein
MYNKKCQLFLGRNKSLRTFVLIQKYQKIKAKRMPPALSCVRRLGGKPARAEADGDAAAKKRACKLFLPPCLPTACARGLATGRRPVSVSERDTP